MKNLKKLLFFIILFIPFSVKAYGIENYYIDATVEEDGDLLVQEYFNLTGTYNGFERIILHKNDDLYEFDPNMSSFGGSLIHNGDSLEIIEVRAVPINSSFSFDNIGGDVFSRTSSASKGDYGVYQQNFRTDGISVLMYNPSSYQKAFYIKYRIKNIVIKHNDVAEIGWNVVGNELSESVGNLKVYLHIPNNTNIRAWAHGPYNGRVNIINSETVEFTVSNLSSYRAVDIRATFDLGIIPNSTKTTGVDALNKIILYETDKAEQANYDRLNREKIILQDATEALSRFEVNITRYNYNSARTYINLLNSSDTKTEYLNRLTKAKIELDQIEESDARKALEDAKEYGSYYWYNRAKEKILILDNMDVKQELLKELSIVEDILKRNELKQEKKNYAFGFLLGIILIILGYIIYRKYVKDPATEFENKYFRDLPNDYSPETVSYLFHKKVINRAMSASLMELINRKVITAEKIDRNNYRLTLNESKDIMVTNVESKLLDLIFDGESTTQTKYMKRSAKKDYDGFISRWKSYERAAYNNAKNNSIYENDDKSSSKNKKIGNNSNSSIIIFFVIFSMLFPPVIIIAVMVLIPVLFIKLIINIFKTKELSKTGFVFALLFCTGISMYKFINILVLQKFHNQSFIVFILLSLLSLTLIPFVFYTKKRTKKGAEEYKKWKALKNFLNDFGKFSDKEVPEIALWEKYLVYATLFGCAKKVIKVMKVEMIDQPNDYFDTYLDLYTMNRYITNTVRQSHSAAQSAYNAAHSSSSGGGFSSGGGGGGGFSSGGGSFGGGGGGGRF